MNRFARVLLFACLLSVNSSYASAPSDMMSFSPPQMHSNGISQENFKKELAEAMKRKNLRKPSNNMEITDDSMMSKELRSFREEYLKVKTPEALHNLIVEAEKNIANYPQDLKFVVTQLIVFKSLHGVVYRMVPMVKKTSVTHSFLLTLVRNVAANIKIYFPTDTWDAGFKYLTEPYKENGKVVSQFQNVGQFQYFLGTDVYKALDQSASYIDKMNLTNSQVLWDNKFVFGTESFDDNLARFRVLTEADRHYRLAMLHSAMENISIFVAYRLDNLADLLKDQGKIYGIDGFLLSAVEGAPSVKRVETLCAKRECADGKWNKKYDKLFTLREKVGIDWTKRAFFHLEQAFEHVKLGWTETQNLNNSEFFVMNPARLMPWDRQIEKNLENIEAMLKGPTKIRSVFTGETVVVNVPNLYNNPPADLKDLMPNKWELGSKTLKKDGIQHTNYYWGRAIGWKIDKYKPYFEISTNADLIRATRVLDQAWGGWFVQLPIKRMVE